MANPNILTATSIYGKSLSAEIPYSSTYGNPGSGGIILENPSGSGKVLKVNNWTASNQSRSSNNITIFSLRKNGSYRSLLTVDIAAGEKVIFFNKENPYYLEENDSLVIHSPVTTRGTYVVSYEEIS